MGALFYFSDVLSKALN